MSPRPFGATPVFMADDDSIRNCDFSIHLTEWDPGCEIDEHMHPDGFEAMYLISGEGKVYIDGVEHPFVPDSMIVAPPTIVHKIINTGTEKLRVLCVFSPPVTGKSLQRRALEAINVELENGQPK